MSTPYERAEKMELLLEKAADLLAAASYLKNNSTDENEKEQYNKLFCDIYELKENILSCNTMAELNDIDASFQEQKANIEKECDFFD